MIRFSEASKYDGECIESRENKASGWMVQLVLALLFSKLVFSCFVLFFANC